jgi:transcriptional regulator with XRE-family HTH domain
MVERIKHIMDEKGLSASQFADRMDVPRAILSHILSGRNKPSLDVVLKIADTYRDINLEWLLLGNGRMLTNLVEDKYQDQVTSNSISHQTEVTASMQVQSNDDDIIQDNVPMSSELKRQETGMKALKQVMFFYKDGTFEVFNPSK